MQLFENLVFPPNSFCSWGSVKLVLLVARLETLHANQMQLILAWSFISMILLVKLGGGVHMAPRGVLGGEHTGQDGDVARRAVAIQLRVFSHKLLHVGKILHDTVG